MARISSFFTTAILPTFDGGDPGAAPGPIGPAGGAGQTVLGAVRR
jgi:hypothetical protein